METLYTIRPFTNTIYYEDSKNENWLYEMG